MKRTLFVIVLLFVDTLAYSQNREIVVRKFYVDLGDMRAKSEPVPDKNGKFTALIEIVSSSKDTLHIESDYIMKQKQHLPGKWLVYLSEGASWIDITVEGCEPFRFEFPTETQVLSAHTYILDIYIKVKDPMRTLIMPTFSYNKSQYSYGLMLALCKKNGGFIHAKTDFHFGLNPEISCDGDGLVDGVMGWFSGESSKSRFALTAGYMRQIIPQLYVFIGGGYGSRILAWELYRAGGSFEYVRVDPYSFNGFEAELGAIYRLGSFAISAGVQTNQFKYLEANVGLGVMF